MAMKILLATDGSSYSDAAVAEVGRRPWPAGSEVRLLTVDEPLDANRLHGGAPTIYDQLVQEQRADAQRHLSAAFQQLKQASPELRITAQLKEGRPKEVILNEAEQWGADLIVIGSRGYGAFRRMVLGSVSLAIATNARCSVEIVRTPSQTA